MGKQKKKKKASQPKPQELRLTIGWVGAIHGLMILAWVILMYAFPNPEGSWVEKVDALWPWIMGTGVAAWWLGVFLQSLRGGPYTKLASSYIAGLMLGIIEGGLLVVIAFALAESP